MLTKLLRAAKHECPPEGIKVLWGQVRRIDGRYLGKFRIRCKCGWQKTFRVASRKKGPILTANI